MTDTHAPLSPVQLAEADLLAAEFAAVMAAAPSYLLAALVPVVRYVRREGITIKQLVATGFPRIPSDALAPLIVAAAACDGGNTTFGRKLLAVADALEAG